MSSFKYRPSLVSDSSVLKVLNLNTWGLTWPWSEDRNYRFRALKEIIALSNYDIILLQEVWYRNDYDVIRKSVPYITYFESFNAGCTAYWLPFGCSGLAILSRHPIEKVEFRPFSYRGSFWNFDGEIFVSKGVARARVRWEGLSVDVFTTHMVSYTNNPNSDNSHYRFLQSVETARYVSQSDADIKLFGGDLNALPLKGEKQPYQILNSIMSDALLDRYPDASFHPWFATFGNVRNTYTDGASPERIDYLMFWHRPEIGMRTREFVMPMFMTRNDEDKLISLSDHEALHAEFVVSRPRSRGLEHPPVVAAVAAAADESNSHLQYPPPPPSPPPYPLLTNQIHSQDSNRLGRRRHQDNTTEAAIARKDAH